jgi:transposase
MAMIDARLGAEAPEEITSGEAVAGMSLNGVGLANRPLSFTPPCFAKTPLDLWFREGVRAEMFNRFKLGRTLDQVHTYGCALLFNERALAVCAHAGLDMRFHHLDTTSVALTGESVPDRDAQAMTLTPGSSKDHRPDLKQAVLELMVSQDGGVPFVSQRWDGHASDTQIFQERAEALITTLQRSSTPRYLVADAKLYHEAKAATLSQLGCITRIPHTLKRVSQAITQALSWDRWHSLDATTRDHRLE